MSLAGRTALMSGGSRGIGLATAAAYIATDAVKNILGGDTAIARSRSPEIVADDCLTILQQPTAECTGNTYLEATGLERRRVTDFSSFGGTTEQLKYDIFVGPPS